METAHSGFVQSRSTLERPICDEEPPAQIPQPTVDLTSDVPAEEFSTIEPYTGEIEIDSDGNLANSDMESLNLSDTEESIPFELPLPTKYATAGRPLRDVVQNEISEDEMWSPFRNKTDFELARWFIEAKVPKDHIDRYFKKDLGPGDSNIKSAYRLLEAVDQLESGMGMKSWKEGVVSFSEAVSKCIPRTSISNQK